MGSPEAAWASPARGAQMRVAASWPGVASASVPRLSAGAEAPPQGPRPARPSRSPGGARRDDTPHVGGRACGGAGDGKDSRRAVGGAGPAQTGRARTGRTGDPGARDGGAGAPETPDAGRVAGRRAPTASGPRRPARRTAARRRARPRATAPARTGRPQSPPIRLTRRGRVVVLAAILAMILGALWVGTRVAATASADPAPAVAAVPA